MRFRVIEPFKRGNKVYRDGEIWLTEIDAQPLVAAGLIVADPAPAAVPAEQPAAEPAAAPAPAPRRRRSST